MERDIVINFEDIYTHIKTDNENDKDGENIVNQKLLNESSPQTHMFCCSSFLECLSSCCFLLYV
jgi:hypothetical protein